MKVTIDAPRAWGTSVHSRPGTPGDTTRRGRHPDHLDLLEAHAVFVMREVSAECERPVLLFSGGKDSAVLLRLAEKAFRPGRFPFPIMHVDTGHNFEEVIEFRDKRVVELGEELVVTSVQDSITSGRVADPGPGESRNRLQNVTLLDAIAEHRFDACIGGARARRTKRGQRRGSCRFATRAGSGTRRANAQSCGTSTTDRSARANIYVRSRSRTGPSSTSGSTSAASTSSYHRSTSLTDGWWWNETACCWPSPIGSLHDPTSHHKRRAFVSEPSATPRAREQSAQRQGRSTR